MQTYIIVTNTNAYLDVLEAIDDKQQVRVNDPLIMTLSKEMLSHVAG